MWPAGMIALITLIAASVPMSGQDAPDAPAWRVELRSSGGFTGRGMGGVAVQADGTVALLHFGVAGGQSREWKPTCTVRLPEKIKPVADALQSSRPEAWRERYTPPDNPSGCCDFLQWDLEVTRRIAGDTPARRRTSWVGDDKSGLPEDLGRLRKAMLEVWNAAKSSCAAQAAARF